MSLCDLEFFALQRPVGGDQQDLLASRVRGVHDPLTIAATRPDLVRRESFSHKVLDRPVRRLRRAQIPVLGRRYHFDAELQAVLVRTHLLGAVREAVQRGRPDFLFVSPQTNPIGLLLGDAGSTRLVLASYDVERVRMERLAQAARGLARVALGWEAARARRFERDNLGAYDGVIAVSALDRGLYVDEYGFEPARVAVVENGVDPAYFAFEPRRRVGPPQILYVGNLRYPPNAQAARRLLDRIVPAVWRTLPAAQVAIVGEGPPPDLAARAQPGRVVVTGRVDDVRPFLAAAGAGCFPLLAGSGTKYKVLEAFAAGVPLVCSPLAVEGLDVTPGTHVRLGETDEEIARELIGLLQDPAAGERLARAGRALVEGRYAWDVILPRLDGWLESVRGQPRRQAVRA